MIDTSPLTDAANRFADRLRSAPQSRLKRGAAAEGLALARELSARAQRLEGLAPGVEPREMPDAGPFAVGDQLVVAAVDLAEALRAVSRPAEAGAASGGPEGAGSAGTAPSEAVDEAVRCVAEAAARAGL
ncbi:hypothetical protein ACN20G_15845 [Streptomyces sp. BI20]|uniref:hypothetical protein n=1 Tax=Streptomyces sp. BI20 TaxID=3403460 RepID=UPI003C7347E1